MRRVFLVLPLLLGACSMSQQEMESGVHDAAAKDPVLLEKIIKQDAKLASFARPDGRTPLHEAGSRKAVELLMDAGADLKAKDGNGRMPLHTAHAAEVAEALFEKGADWRLQDGSRRTAIQTVPDGGAALVLIRKGAELTGDTESVAPLVLAVQEGRSAVAQVLIEAGADCRMALGYHKDTLLHQAAARGDKIVVEALLAKRVEVDARNFVGATPLHSAVLNDRLEVAALLLENGADPNAKLSAGAAVADTGSRRGPMPASFGSAGGQGPLQLSKSPAMTELLKRKGATE